MPSIDGSARMLSCCRPYAPTKSIHFPCCCSCVPLHASFSETPKGYFMEDVEENIEAGNRIWGHWWGVGAVPGVNGTGSPLNTDCLCSLDTCLDQ